MLCQFFFTFFCSTCIVLFLFLRWYFLPYWVLFLPSVHLICCFCSYVHSFKCVYRMSAKLPWHYCSFLSQIQAIFVQTLYLLWWNVSNVLLIPILSATNLPFPFQITTPFYSFSLGQEFPRYRGRAGMKLGWAEDFGLSSKTWLHFYWQSPLHSDRIRNSLEKGA